MGKKIKILVFFGLLAITLKVNAVPANDMFLDDNLYKCIIDAYNLNKEEKKDYTYSILPEEVTSITNLDCSNYKGSIEDLTGLDKMIGLTSLNLSGNTFLGGSLTITGKSGKLSSNIKLPSNISLEDVSYSIENDKIVKINNNVVYPLSAGSTYVTMTAKVLGSEIIEKYLVSVAGETNVKSDNAKLASLFLSKGDFSFDSDTRSYITVVDKSVESVQVNANVLHEKAKFVSGFGPRTVNLKIGSNEILVKVQAENGTINTYTIDVIRSDGNNLNNRLANIQLSVGEISFDPDIFIYNFSVDSNVDEILVDAVAESSLAKVDVSNTKLKVGSNKITITVTAESGLSTKYELIVTREDYDSSDNYLKDIVIKNYPISFNRNVFNYNITINGENKLAISPVTEKNDATYEIVGNNKLKNGSKILIKVSDKEGSIREYSINIKKNGNVEIKWIILLLEFITIIALLLYIIFRGGNKPKRPKKNKNKEHIKVKVTTNVCQACGTVNDLKSKTCYVCGNLLN